MNTEMKSGFTTWNELYAEMGETKCIGYFQTKILFAETYGVLLLEYRRLPEIRSARRKKKRILRKYLTPGTPAVVFLSKKNLQEE